ncbi:MAG: flagellar hook assembly protein FlgD [SAR324 cluster bacterium]|nr:flagellar hook assembly protein FlgD [SAR324 cluster bacterium]MBF0349424.1 flagellar hook assembly protein FlgD [SAR324 cluster bacterium]
MDTTAVQQALGQASNSQRNAAVKTHGPPKDSKDGKELGKQDFLNLLMTQMANQDPMDPMDSKSMMAQLSAMGTLEQLQNMNSKMDQLLTHQSDIAQASSSVYLDKDVELASPTLTLKGGVSAPVTYSLGGDAAKVSIYITNDKGDMVRTINMDHQGPGEHAETWDGKDDDGDVLSDGAFRYEVIAKTETGENIEVSQNKKGRISKLDFKNGRSMVEINGEWLPAEKIQRLGNDSLRRFDSAMPLPLRKDLNTRKLVIPPAYSQASKPEEIK